MNGPNNSDQKPKKPRFIRLSGRSKWLLIVGIAAAILLAAAIFFGVMFFMQIGIFKILGIEYESWGDIVGFLLLTFMFDIIMSIVLFAVKIVWYNLMRGASPRTTAIMLGLAQIVLDLVAVHIIDEWMTGVTLSNLSELLLVLIVFAIDKLTPGSRRIKFRIFKR